VEAGAHRATWDGKDDTGKNVVSGVYFYRMEGDDFVRTRKMVLLK
jgi:flagellar hook assembly protein FlgD